jgi:hypothetical protein
VALIPPPAQVRNVCMVMRAVLQFAFPTHMCSAMQCCDMLACVLAQETNVLLTNANYSSCELNALAGYQFV